MEVAIDGHAGGRVAVMVVVMGVMLARVVLVVALVVVLVVCWWVVLPVGRAGGVLIVNLAAVVLLVCECQPTARRPRVKSCSIDASEPAERKSLAETQCINGTTWQQKCLV